MWLLLGVFNLLLAIAVARLWKERTASRSGPVADRETLEALRSYREEIRSLVEDADERLGRRCSELEACICRADALRREIEALEVEPKGPAVPVASSGASRIQELSRLGREPADIARVTGCSLREVNLALSFRRQGTEKRSRIGILD
jgi:hypothetical protein